METNGHIITGTNNRVDTRLLDGESRHVYISIVDLNHVSVIGVQDNRLVEYFEESEQTIEEFNELIAEIGMCTDGGDIFVVTVSDSRPPLCIKLFGNNDFTVVTSTNSDGTRFSILPIGATLEYINHEEEDA